MVLYVVDGHHKIKAYQELGKDIPVIEIVLVKSKSPTLEQSVNVSKYVEEYKELTNRRPKSIVFSRLLPRGAVKEYFNAMYRQDFTKAFELVNNHNHPELVHDKDLNGKTALMWAMHKEAIGIARILLELGANPNVRDNLKKSAAHHAVDYDNADALQLLVNFGADLSYKSNEHVTPLMQAAQRGNMACIAKLNELVNLMTPEVSLLSRDSIVAIQREMNQIIKFFVHLDPKEEILDRQTLQELKAMVDFKTVHF